MICRPPKYSTTAWPRLAIRKMSGNRNEKVCATLSCCANKLVGGDGEAPLFVRLAREGPDHLQAGHVLLQHGVERADPHSAPGMNSGWAISAEDEEGEEGDRQDRQDDQRQGVVGQPEDDQRGDQQDDRLQRHHQALAR